MATVGVVNGSHLAPTYLYQMNQVNFHNDASHDDSSININVLLLIIIIIKSLLLMSRLSVYLLSSSWSKKCNLDWCDYICMLFS